MQELNGKREKNCSMKEYERARNEAGFVTNPKGFNKYDQLAEDGYNYSQELFMVGVLQHIYVIYVKCLHKFLMVIISKELNLGLTKLTYNITLIMKSSSIIRTS